MHRVAELSGVYKAYSCVPLWVLWVSRWGLCVWVGMGGQEGVWCAFKGPVDMLANVSQWGGGGHYTHGRVSKAFVHEEGCPCTPCVCGV